MYRSWYSSTIEGATSYIEVTALKDESIVYFAGDVAVGDIFTLEDGGERFEADQKVRIFDSQGGTLLQDTFYHSSCSQNLDLKNRFGAVQIVGWFNEEQGEVSCFANATFDMAITIPVTITGETITLSSFVIISTFGTYNLTDEYAGTVLEPGDTIETAIQVTLDLTVRRRYTFLATIVGETDEGVEC
jgi:hypothetical protein